MKTMDYDNYMTNVLKAELLLSDYAIATDPEEKRVYLDLLDRYVSNLDIFTVRTIFDRMATVKNYEENDLYVQILTDVLSDLRKN